MCYPNLKYIYTVMYNIYVTILLHRAGDLIYVYAYYNPGKYEPKVKIIGGVPHTNKRLIH